MWDRYGPRDDVRDRGNAWDRSLGGRGSTGDRDRNEERDPRDVFTRDLDLPRGSERRPVRERERVYEINGTESRMLGTVGAFRVVSESDLHKLRNDSDSSRRSAQHLEREGLIRTNPLSSDDRAVVLTDRGRDLLEANRYERQGPLARAPADLLRGFQEQWLDDPRNTLWMAGSPIVADAIDRELGRVECVELSRQYLHLSPLVDVA